MQDNNYHPLHWASYKSDHAECAQLLVDSGAELNVKSARGFTPLQMATGNNNLVSAKPGVAAVLEDATRHPRPSWSRSRVRSAPLPSPAAHAPSPSSPLSSSELPEDFNGRSRSARNSRELAWSPLAAAQEAAEVAARTPSGSTPSPTGQSRSAPLLPRERPVSRSTPELPQLPPSTATTSAAWTNEALAAVAASPSGRRRTAPSTASTLPHWMASLAAGGAAAAACWAMASEVERANPLGRWPAEGGPTDAAPAVADGALAPPAADGLPPPQEEDGSAAALPAAALSTALPTALSSLELPTALSSLALRSTAAGVLTCLAVLMLVRLLARRRASAASAATGRRPAAKDTPSQFLCPITGEVMRDPVTTADGHAFERGAIERWLLTSEISPMTGIALPHKQLAPAIALRQLIGMHMATTWNQ